MPSHVFGAWTIPREHPRFLIDIRLVVRSEKVLHGRTKNLGEGGLGATIAGDLQLGEIVRLEFQLPEVPDPMAIHAEVRYRKGFQFGFKFINPTQEQCESIRRATRALPTDASGAHL